MERETETETYGGGWRERQKQIQGGGETEIDTGGLERARGERGGGRQTETDTEREKGERIQFSCRSNYHVIVLVLLATYLAMTTVRQAVAGSSLGRLSPAAKQQWTNADKNKIVVKTTRFLPIIVLFSTECLLQTVVMRKYLHLDIE